jgi:hypothetical protein
MSDDKISLEFPGEQMFRMQADLRGVRAEQVKMEGEQASIRADVAGMRTDVRSLDAKVGSLDAKIDRVDAKVDNLGRSMDAGFDQVNETAATNLDIVLKAIDAGRS